MRYEGWATMMTAKEKSVRHHFSGARALCDGRKLYFGVMDARPNKETDCPPCLKAYRHREVRDE